jgi:hypothetical protein
LSSAICWLSDDRVLVVDGFGMKLTRIWAAYPSLSHARAILDARSSTCDMEIGRRAKGSSVGSDRAGRVLRKCNHGGRVPRPERARCDSPGQGRASSTSLAAALGYAGATNPVSPERAESVRRRVQSHT